MSGTDKRAYPRVHLVRPMVLHGENGARVEATLRNATPRGLQVVCDRASAQALIPPGTRDRRTLRLVARFQLPVDARLEDVAVECRLAHLSLLPEEEKVAIGLSFLAFEDDSGRVLRRFLVESLAPA